MEDVFKTAGASKASKPDAGGAGIRSVPVFGVVKNNIDPVRTGRIQVYISDIGSDDPEDPSGWATVSYLPPYYGFTTPKAGETGYGEYIANPSSYGYWNSPPDIGTTVICIFVNGDPNYGFYIGCVPKPEALHMVPAIGASTNVLLNNSGEANGYGGAEQLPVTNINTNNASLADSANFLDEAKPVHSYSASIYMQQGLIRDTIRGPITSSSQRETPSRVGWGVSTPGRPIYEGGYDDETINQAIEQGAPDDKFKLIARRGGHSIVMDDGDLIGKDQLVRIRSAKGHQILMSDDGQTLFIIHSNGQSYIELGKEGTIDLYSTNSFNVRTQGDINFHSDNNFNIHAAKKLSIQAEEIQINSDKSTLHKSGTDYSVYTMGTFTHKVDGPMSMESSGEASFASSGITYINGSRINLNTGSTSTTPEKVDAISLVAHTDTLHDPVKGYAAAPGKLISITSRAPAHTPWANANQGVDIKTSNSASKQLPSAPKSVVQAANQAAASTPVNNPVTGSSVATIPPVNSVSNSVDQNATSAMVSAVAQNAATGPAAAAVAQGFGVVSTAQGKIASIGSLAQTPAQLESAGILKPGSSNLINSQINAGVPISKAMTNNLFTGKPGAENLLATVQNVQTQVSAQVTNFQKAQSALTNAGVITGKEDPSAIAGSIVAAATAGVGPTLNVLKDIGADPTKFVNGQVSGAASAVTSALTSGNFATNLTSTGMGALGSIAGAVGAAAKINGTAGLQAASRGVSAAAFNSITSAWKPLLVLVPQNLRSIASAGAALGEAVASGTASPQTIANRAGRLAAAAGERGFSTAAAGIGSGINAINAIGNARTTTQILGAGSNLLSSAGKIAGAVGNKDISKTASQLSNATKGVTNVINSANRLANATNVGQVLSSASNIINNTNRIASTFGVSSKASGLSSLPGGQLSVSSVVNQALKNVSLPGVPGLKSVIASTLASTINKIPIPQNINALKSKTNNLQSLALAGLAPGAAAQLNSAISSLSSMGPAPIKLPTVGLNTFDRSDLTSQVNSLLGNSKIPRPNFDGVSVEAAQSLSQRLSQQQELYKAKKQEADGLYLELELAKKNFFKLKQTLDKGDPEVENARLIWNAAFDRWNASTTELQQILLNS